MYARCVLDLLAERRLLPPVWRAAWLGAGTDLELAALLERMVGEGAFDRTMIQRVLAEEFRMSRVDPGPLEADRDAITLVPAERALASSLLPLRRAGRTITVAIANPFDTRGLDEIGRALELVVDPRLADPNQLDEALRRYYGTEAGLSGHPASVNPDAHRSDTDTRREAQERETVDAGVEPIRRFVGRMIEEAVHHRASDVHLESAFDGLRIRFRVDGKLIKMPPPPASLGAAILSHLKLESGMSISERRLPQDGRIAHNAAGRSLDLRLASIPGIHGEHLVIRVLDGGSGPPGLDGLGMSDSVRIRIQEDLTAPQGMLLVTGPTGSGKTTTLYACLRLCNRPDNKVITVEDPIEYALPGVTQARVRSEVGMTFSTALRAILRQAPNTIMIGEIRDFETADMAFQAALTGHAVFSTLHTNHAAAAVSRLIDIGVRRFVVAAALRAVLAQRLVRRVCSECREPSGGGEWLERLLIQPNEEVLRGAPLRGRGCSACNGSGFHGRSGIFEFMPVSDRLRRVIHQNPSERALRECAGREGMRTMREDGIRQACAGITTVEEVLGATIDEA